MCYTFDDMKKKKLLILLVSVLLIAAVFFLWNIMATPSVEHELVSYDSERFTISVDIHNRNMFNGKHQIAIDSKTTADADTQWQAYTKKEYELTPGTYYIHVKDEFGHTVDTPSILDRTLSLTVNNDFYPFYPVDQIVALDLSTVIAGTGDPIEVVSSDPDVASILGGDILCKSPGTTTITVSSGDVKESFPITVTDLYTLPEEDSSKKPFLKETICTEEEAHMLDEVLERKIEEAGYQTRAGVVAAARFLALEFPYKLAYFSESGRLDPASAVQIDGEGRYYHKGLYLSEDKFADISISRYGPAYWGQFFLEDTTDDHSLDDYYLYDGFVPADIGSKMYLMKRPNGLDCSGHVSWCYYNGGFDLGDLGAGGPGSHGMTELGELVMIDEELLKSDRIKAGDLVGMAAHIGIVIGVDEEHIWISDNLVSGLKNTCYDRTMESFEQLGSNSWKYFILMDSEYKEDGNYTPMW